MGDSAGLGGGTFLPAPSAARPRGRPTSAARMMKNRIGLFIRSNPPARPTPPRRITARRSRNPLKAKLEAALEPPLREQNKFPTARLDLEVKYDDLFNQRQNKRLHALVFGVWNVSVPGGAVGESHYKPVSVAFVQSFRTVIGAGNIVFDSRHIFAQLD